MNKNDTLWHAPKKAKKSPGKYKGKVKLMTTKK